MNEPVPLRPWKGEEMELLAPAGDFACLEAAIENGADAVYLGMKSLNARSGARNFSSHELRLAADIARRADVNLHLTINIDLAERELGLAARMLSFARDVGIHAVIVRDPAVVDLWRRFVESEWTDGHYPQLHFSTQTAVFTVHDALAAKRAGASRIVLARELTLDEISAIRREAEIEVEVFAQGALCYCVSGRCLMSSWGGGRSGNRGQCTSPCRVPWEIDGKPAGTRLSMRDLSTIDRLKDLEKAGVDALKIEGRLKRSRWVGEAVRLYRQALGAGKRGNPELQRDQAIEASRRLASYAGRDITSGYLSGDYAELTGTFGRPTSMDSDDMYMQPVVTAASSGWGVHAGKKVADETPVFRLRIMIDELGVLCTVSSEKGSEEWRLPKTVIKRRDKALSLHELIEGFKFDPVPGARLEAADTNDPSFLLPPRNYNLVRDRVRSFINRMIKSSHDDSLWEVKLPGLIRDELRGLPVKNSPNSRRLGDQPNCLRLRRAQLLAFPKEHLDQLDVCVVGATIDDLDKLVTIVDPYCLTLALPSTIFPDSSPNLEKFCQTCSQMGLTVEVNTWGQIHLCRQYNLPFHAGPGLPVLNHMAAEYWNGWGAKSVTVSLEADRERIESLCTAATVPLRLFIYSHPMLMVTRLPMDLLNPGTGADESNIWADRRGIKFHPDRLEGTTSFRSLIPFDWSGLNNRRIRVNRLVADLTGELDPVAAWGRLLWQQPPGEPFLFNYERGLK